LICLVRLIGVGAFVTFAGVSVGLESVANGVMIASALETATVSLPPTEPGRTA
jgi:hypothetical protein